MESVKLTASDGYELCLNIYEAQKPKACIQILHGMEEHQGRYRDFAGMLAAAGYTAITSDMRGHGANAPVFGFFKEKNGWKYLLDDQKRITAYIRERYGVEKIAVFAHSMELFRQDDITDTQYKTAVLDLGRFYDSYVQEQGCNAGFYFRFIHNLVSFVIEHWKDSPQDIHKYLNFIQAQLSDEELALIFYDSISNLGLDKQHKYTFKENLDKNSFLENLSSDVLLAREHYKVFPRTRFRFLNADELKKNK